MSALRRGAGGPPFPGPGAGSRGRGGRGRPRGSAAQPLSSGGGGRGWPRAWPGPSSCGGAWTTWRLLSRVSQPGPPVFHRSTTGPPRPVEHLGIANIATTSTGYRAAGRGLNRHRKRQLDLRKKLQAKGTKSAKRLLKKRARKEARHAANVNHIVAKTIVTTAERTCHGIALEDLTGIRDRVRLRKDQRTTVHSWSFHQLGRYIAYKARRAGVPLVYVDPAYTSRQCSQCHHIDRKNRVDQATFACRSCGSAMHADINASRNIACKGEVVWIAGRESRVPATAT
ncbi:RNA-guided endonuclease InsQ/TnpB family protein [Kitasatospora sp. NPDC001683]